MRAVYRNTTKPRPSESRIRRVPSELSCGSTTTRESVWNEQPSTELCTLANTLASSLNTLDVICEDIYHISEWAANARNEVTNQGSSFDGLVDRMYTAIQRCQAAGRAA